MKCFEQNKSIIRKAEKVADEYRPKMLKQLIYQAEQESRLGGLETMRVKDQKAMVDILEDWFEALEQGGY